MADKKVDYNTGEAISQPVLENTTLPDVPPPYMDDEPPPYSSIATNNYPVYQSLPPLSSEYEEKLPFDVPDNPQAPPAPASTCPVPNQNQQVTNQYNNSASNLSALPIIQQSSAPHRMLLQPSSSRIVETVVGRRTTKSHVTDLETGKEYFVKERTSRSGRRSKAVIKEVGGPKTLIKETPSKTIVSQKKK